MVVLAVVSRGLLSRRLRLILDVSFFVCLWMDVQMIYLAFFLYTLFLFFHSLVDLVAVQLHSRIPSG